MHLIVKNLGTTKVFFSSDYHFGHVNILKYCDRPFTDIEEMNETIIQHHNKIVGPNDIMYFLGDFSFHDAHSLLERMNGNFIFVKGNHDHKTIKKLSVNYAIISYDKYKFLCVHKPQHIYGEFNLNIVGHVHTEWQYNSELNAFNVGVDQNDFSPVSLDTLMAFV